MNFDDRIGELMSIMSREQDLINYQVLRESVFKTRLDKRIFVSSRPGLHNVINKINSEYLIIQAHEEPDSINQDGSYTDDLSKEDLEKALVDLAKQYIDSEYLCLSMALRMSNRTTQENIDDMVELADEHRGEQVKIESLKSMRSGLLSLVVDIFINMYGYSNKEIEILTGYSNEYVRILGGAGCEMDIVNRFFYMLKKLLKDKIRTSMDYIIEYQCGYIFLRESHQSRYFIVLRELEPKKLYELGKIPEDVLDKVFDCFMEISESKKDNPETNLKTDSLRAKADDIIQTNLSERKKIGKR